MVGAETKPHIQTPWEKVKDQIRVLRRPSTADLADNVYSASFRRAYAGGDTTLEGSRETTQVQLKFGNKKFTAVWHINYNVDGHGSRTTELVVFDSVPEQEIRRRLKISIIEPIFRPEDFGPEHEYGEYDPFKGERKLELKYAREFLTQLSQSKVDMQTTENKYKLELENVEARKREIGKEIKFGWARNMNAFGIIPLELKSK